MSGYNFNQSIAYGAKSQDYSGSSQILQLNNSNKCMQNSIEKYKNNNNDQNNTDNNSNFRVFIRIRPFLPREIDNGKTISTLQVTNDHKMIQAIEFYNYDFQEGMTIKEILENTNKYTIHPFTFDYVFTEETTQVEVYEKTAKPAVHSVLMGYNATILAYGQTGTGKTHTMEGFKYSSQDSMRGIIPRCMEEIFKYIENISNSKTTFMVRASYLQIYNETIADLLRTDRTGLIIREDKKKGLYVDGLSEWAVRSPSEIYSLIQKGAASRATASTKMNDVSSRSHAVFLITVEQMMETEDVEDHESSRQIRVGKLNLVDLAGSERVRVTGATGQRLEECKKINQSLSALGNVISALSDQRQPKTHIPYRDSKITRLLEDSLGGNCITTMMAMVSPSMDAFTETLSSIKFANRAKNIRNAPVINEDVDQKALLRKYEAELNRLRSELEERNKILMDKRKLHELEEERRKAEMHKVAAVAALEARSKEFMEEREEKKKLEEKIRSMNSQLLVGGRKIEDTPQFRSALEEQQKLIRQQYEKRLMDLEKERTQIEEDKAQVDCYKQLLLKQRDIMIALTTRLNERDETIIQLQEELDAFDRIHRETEDNLELQKNKAERLEQILKEHNIQVPNDQDMIASPDNTNKKTESEPKNYNPDVVRYDGEETYNITKGNLSDAEEKINELTKIVDNQKQEILKLQKEIENYRALNFDNQHNSHNESSTSLLDHLKKTEDRENNLLKMLKKKDDEIKNMQSANNMGQFYSSNQNIEIKRSIDHIIECLSGQNEPEQLQEVAKKLLNLQKLVNNSMQYSNNQNNNFSNIQESQSKEHASTNSYNSAVSNHNDNQKLLNSSSHKLKQSNSSGSKQLDDSKHILSSKDYINNLNMSLRSLENTQTSVQGNGISKPLISSLNDLSNTSNENGINRHHYVNSNEGLIKANNLSGQTSNTNQLINNSGSLRGEIAKLIASRGHARHNTNENDNSSGYLKEKLKKSSYNLDNYMNIDPKRQALTVEEMLKLKREEGNRSKCNENKI